jgi:hypothetical protein
VKKKKGEKEELTAMCPNNDQSEGRIDSLLWITIIFCLRPPRDSINSVLAVADVFLNTQSMLLIIYSVI